MSRMMGIWQPFRGSVQRRHVAACVQIFAAPETGEEAAL